MSPLVFYRFWRLICNVGSEVCFSVGLGAEMTPGCVLRCTENIINIMIYIRFHFFRSLVKWVIFNRLWDVF